jgi:hypothetical protein
MGLHYVGNGKIVLTRKTQIFVDVPARVHNDGETVSAAQHV